LKNVSKNKKLPAGKLSPKPRIALVWALCLVLVVVAAGLAGAWHYRFKVAPLRQTVLVVDDYRVSMGYLLKRIKMNQSDPNAMLEQLVFEELIRQTAPQIGVIASKADVDQALRDEAFRALFPGTTTAVGGVNQLGEAAFWNWYQQQLRESGLSDSEYRDVVTTDILAAGMEQYLASGLPTRAEQIHLHALTFSSYTEVEKALRRINTGESFLLLAAEVSASGSNIQGQSEDLGWIPRGVIPFDDIVFNMNIGEVSAPVMLDAANPDSTRYSIFMVSERSLDREINQYLLQALSYRRLHTWLQAESAQHAVTYHFTAANQAWLEAQLAGDG
jgi:hypothetical protein